MGSGVEMMADIQGKGDKLGDAAEIQVYLLVNGCVRKPKRKEENLRYLWRLRGSHDWLDVVEKEKWLN